MLPIPSYISNNNILHKPLTFNWSSSIALKLYAQSDLNMRIYDAANASSFKANLALAVCICEWSLYRLEGFVNLDDAWQRVNAAWCSVVNPTYSKNVRSEMPDDVNVKGDPRGPLAITFAHLYDAVRRSKMGSVFLAKAVMKQAVLARHICPNQAAFDLWLSDVFRATAIAYPRTVEYDKDSEYYDASAEIPVLREFFETLTAPKVNNEVAVNAFLAGLDPSTNPYLASAKEMLEAGYKGTPYQYP